MSARTAALAVLLVVLATGCKNTDHPTAATNSVPAPATVSTPTPSAPPSTPPPTPTPKPTPTPTVDIGKLSVTQIAAKTEAAAKAVRSVHVQGTMTSGKDRIGMDVRLTQTDGGGTVSMNGDRFSVVVVGQTAYLRFSDAFWRHHAKSKAEAKAITQLINGRWIKTTTSNKDFRELAVFARKSGFYDTLFVDSESGDPTGVKKKGRQTVAGVTCIGLGDSDVTVWIARATAYPIRFDAPGTELTFTEYDHVVPPKAPPADQVIDGDALDSL
ncbi:hypothetical protein AB0E69_10360 [Kribbella sp. NPDC026611]|uniref:hypothetical protein n=1 Tax=Kribbella sp. NPDC026611 TaxID=3154911 RepID=UPI0033DF5F35